jgi:hypothetical protein
LRADGSGTAIAHGVFGRCTSSTGTNTGLEASAVWHHRTPSVFHFERNSRRMFEV